MVEALRERKVPLFINQLRYNPLDRRAEAVFGTAVEQGFGVIAFSPLEQGILTGKYRQGIPDGSRAKDKTSFLKHSPDAGKVEKAARLEDLAGRLGCTLIELVFAWILRTDAVCSVLAGASRAAQVEENVRAVGRHCLTEDECRQVEAVLAEEDVQS